MFTKKTIRSSSLLGRYYNGHTFLLECSEQVQNFRPILWTCNAKLSDLTVFLNQPLIVRTYRLFVNRHNILIKVFARVTCQISGRCLELGHAPKVGHLIQTALCKVRTW